MHQRSFPATAGADDSHHFSRRNAQIYVVQNLAPFLTVAVGEMHMLEADALVKWGKRDSVRLLVNVVAGIEEVEDRRRCADGLLEVVVELRELAYRLVELEDRNDEGEKNALRE